MTIQTDLAEFLTDQFKLMLVTMSNETGVLGQNEDGVDVSMFSESQWNNSLDGESGPSMQELVLEMYTQDVAAFEVALGQNKTGRATFSAGTSVSVTGLDFADDDYSIMLTPDANIPVWYESKDEDGFTIKTAGASSDTVDWSVIKDPASPEVE